MALLGNNRWELYAQARAQGMTQIASYREAGYETRSENAMAVQASRLETNPKVRARIEELNGRKAKGVVLTKQYVLEATIENAEKALGRRPVKITRRVRQDGAIVDQNCEVFLYEPAAANQALRMLGSEVGMYADRKELKIVNEYANLTDQQLAEKLIEIGQQVLLEGPVIEHDEGEGDAS